MKQKLEIISAEVFKDSSIHFTRNDKYGVGMYLYYFRSNDSVKKFYKTKIYQSAIENRINDIPP